MQIDFQVITKYLNNPDGISFINQHGQEIAQSLLNGGDEMPFSKL